MSETLFKHHSKTVCGSAMLEIDINLVHCSKLYQCSVRYRLINNNCRQWGIYPLVFLMIYLNNIPLNRKQNKGQTVQNLRRRFLSLKECLHAWNEHCLCSWTCVHFYIMRHGSQKPCICTHCSTHCSDPSVRGFKVLQATQFLLKQLVSLFL